MALPAAASVLTTGLGAYPTVYYDRKAVAALESSLILYDGCDLKVMPDRSGVAMQIFSYSAMAANLTPATEGTPGAGQTLTQNTKTINLSQFVDYITYSDNSVLTSLSDIVTEGSERLGYRGARSVDTIINNTIDAIANANAGARKDVTDGSYMTAALSRQSAQLLRSINVQPKSNGKYFGAIHSLNAFDLINDSTAGGFIDINKYTDSTQLKSGVTQSGSYPGRKEFVGLVGGVEWFQSNNLNTFAAWQSTSHIAYSAIVIGKDALFASSLSKDKLGQRNFSVRTSKFAAGTVSSDPAGQIAAASSYNFFFGVNNRPDNYGVYRIRVESSIG